MKTIKKKVLQYIILGIIANILLLGYNAHYSKVWAAERLFTFHDTSGGIDEAYIERGDDGYPRLKAKAKAKDSWFLKNIHCRGIDSMGLTGKKGNDNTYPNPSNMITLESHSITRYSSYVMLNWVFKLKSSSFATYFRSPYTLMYDLRLTFNYTVGGDSERMTYYIEDIWDLHGVIDESWWNTPPTTPGAFSAPTASSNLQGGTTYTVNWDASSDSEGDTVKYYLEFYDGSSWTTIASNLNSTNYNWTVPINVGAINNAQLRVKAKDPGGSGSYSSYQSSNSFSIYQNTDPTISLSTSNNQTLSAVNGHNKLNISGTINDENVGDTELVKYTLANSSGNNLSGHTDVTAATLTANGTDQSFSKTITIDSSIPKDTYILKVWVEDDNGGTSSQVTRTFTVDKTPPTAPSISLNPSTATNSNVTVTITYSSDSVTKQYKIGTGSWKNYTGAFTVSSNTTITARATDSVGNTSTGSKNITNIDKTPPTAPSISLNPSTATNSNVTVTITYSSDTATKQYKIGTGSLKNYTGAFTVSSNTTIEARAEDGVGNESTASKAITNIDKTPPEAPSITASPTTPTNGDVNITITYSGDSTVKEYKVGTGSWKEYTGEICVSSNTTVYARAEDGVGNESTASKAVINIDKTPPEAPNITASPTTPTNGDVNITITYSGDSTVKEYKVGTGSWKEYTGEICVSSNTTVYARAKDAVGNESTASKDITNIDKTPPEAPSITASPTTPTNGDVNITITYSGDSAVKEYKVGTGSWKEYTGGFNVSSNTTVYARAEDAVGNESTASKDITNIDKTPPEAPSITASPTTPTNGDVNITITYSGDSAVKEYKVGTGSWKEYTGGFSVSSNTTVYARAEDAVGNESTASKDITNIDKTPPEAPSITASPTTPTNGDVNITITYSGDSAVKEYKVGTGSWKEYTGGFSVSSNATVYARAEDAVGNESTASKAVTNIDKTPPNPPIIQRDPDVDIYNGDYTITIMLGADSQEGDKLQYKLEGAEAQDWKNYSGPLDIFTDGSIHIIAKTIDTAGNSTTSSAIVFSYDELLKDAEHAIATAEKSNKESDQRIAEEKTNLLPESAPEREELLNRLDLVELLEHAKESLDNSIDTLESQQVPSISLPELLRKQTLTFIVEENGSEIFRTTGYGLTALSVLQEGHTYAFKLIYTNSDGSELGRREWIKTIQDLTDPLLIGAYMLDGKLTVLAGDNYKLADNPFVFTLTSDGTVIAHNSVDDTEFQTQVIVEGGVSITVEEKKDGTITASVPSEVKVQISDAAGHAIEHTFSITKANEVLYGSVPSDIIGAIDRNNNPPRKSSSTLDTIQDAESQGITLIDTDLDAETAKTVVETLTSVKVGDTDAVQNSGVAGINVDFGSALSELAKANGIEDPQYRITIVEKLTKKLVYTSTSSSKDNLTIPNLADSTRYTIRIYLVDGSKELAFREIEKETLDATPPVITSVALIGNTLEVTATDNKGLNQKAYSFDVQNGDTGLAYLIPQSSQGDSMYRIDVAGDMQLLGAVASVDNTNNNTWGTNVWTDKNRLGELDLGVKVKIKVRDQSENYTETSVVVTGEDTIINTAANANNPLVLYPNQTMSTADLLQDLFINLNEQDETAKNDAKKQLQELLDNLREDGFDAPEIKALENLLNDLNKKYGRAISLLQSLSKRLEEVLEYKSKAVALQTLLGKINSYSPFDLTNIDLQRYTFTTNDRMIGYFDDKDNLVITGKGKLIITITDKESGEEYHYSIMVDDETFDRRIIVQTNSMTDLAKVFSNAIIRDLGTEQLAFQVDEDQDTDQQQEESKKGSEKEGNQDPAVANEESKKIEIVDQTILKTNDEPGLYTIKATNGKKSVPFYIIVFKNQEPQSLTEEISVPIGYTYKVGDSLKIQDVTFLRNKFGTTDLTYKKYVVVESKNDVVEVQDHTTLVMKKEGIAKINVIDLISKKLYKLKFKVYDFSKKEKFKDIEGSEYKDSIQKLANLGLIRGRREGEFDPDKEATVAEVLTLYSRIKTLKERTLELNYNTNILDLPENHWGYYDVQNALKGMNKFELEGLLGERLDINKKATARMVESILHISLDENDKDFFLSRGEIAYILESLL